MELSSYKIEGQEFDVYVSRPTTPGPHPAVLVCHAWEGRDDFIEGQARKLAESGYVGAAIDVYGVGNRGASRQECEALMMPLISNVALLRARLAAAFEHVEGLDGLEKGKLSVVGYCFGGLCAILMARMGLELRTATSVHGSLKIVESLSVPVRAKLQILFGLDDPMAPPSDLGLFAEEMKRVGADWCLHGYPRVMHSFTNPSATSPELGMQYDEQAASVAWDETLRFLKEQLET